MITLTTTKILEREAYALLTRLTGIKPFVLHTPMVIAAAISPNAQFAIEGYLSSERRRLREMILQYIEWLRSFECLDVPPSEAQRRFAFLRLKFNEILSQFDIFADVLTQRSQHDLGVLLAGLDIVAADALSLPGDYYKALPIICYLDRGYGAAIRRAKTKMPGGGENPVGIIRIPWERMLSSTIVGSLCHEVGHQSMALLDAVNSLRSVLQNIQRKNNNKLAWFLYDRWISEILADFWSVAKVGVVSVLGLMGVISFPKAFVFRLNVEDPHPIPWIRLKLSCAIGDALYPHPQWRNMAELWESLYPVDGLSNEKQSILNILEETMPEFISVMLSHRPQALRGKSLIEAISSAKRHPQILTKYYQFWHQRPTEMRKASPTFFFAAIGQALADGMIDPQEESQLIGKFLTHWAVRNSLDVSANCCI